MADYQKMYAILCGAVDDALMGLEQGSSAACIALRLRLALERAEEIYLETSICLLYTSPSPRDRSLSRMPSSA